MIMRLLALLALLAIAGCTAALPAPPISKTYQEPGLSAFCATHPGQGICP